MPSSASPVGEDVDGNASVPNAFPCGKQHARGGCGVLCISSANFLLKNRFLRAIMWSDKQRAAAKRLFKYAAVSLN